MRTTVRLDDQLLADAKMLAARSDRTLTSVLEDALRESLQRARESSGRARVKLPTDPGGGLRAGVDLDDNSALLDVMDAPERE